MSSNSSPPVTLRKHTWKIETLYFVFISEWRSPAQMENKHTADNVTKTCFLKISLSFFPFLPQLTAICGLTHEKKWVIFVKLESLPLDNKQKLLNRERKAWTGNLCMCVFVWYCDSLTGQRQGNGSLPLQCCHAVVLVREKNTERNRKSHQIKICKSTLGV